tara:strand:+ start:4414 stop:4692 length:279 start_codon:yes stop_codon:yes gene_type:complete
MKEQDVLNIVNNAIEQKLAFLAFNNKNQTPYHIHNGADGTPMLDPINMLPFTVYSAVPTDTSPNGTFKLVYDGANYRLYYRMNNLWKYVTLT